MVVRWECCVCCQVEVSATGRSLVQRSPTDCGVSLSMIYKTARIRRQTKTHSGLKRQYNDDDDDDDDDDNNTSRT